MLGLYLIMFKFVVVGLEWWRHFSWDIFYICCDTSTSWWI